MASTEQHPVSEKTSWDPFVPDIQEVLYQSLIHLGHQGSITKNGAPFYSGMDLKVPNFVLTPEGKSPAIAICPNDKEGYFDIYFNRANQRRWHTEKMVPLCLLSSAINATLTTDNDTEK